jgi:predicted nucleic acid-binding protein
MRAVVDTNVLVGGLARTGVDGQIVDGWVAGDFAPCVSTALALEYEEVLLRKVATARRDEIRKVLQALLRRAEFTPIRFSYRPASPDPDDDHVIDCAMNAGAPVVTSNVRDFASAGEQLGFEVLKPAEFLSILRADEV